jgi:hypothetical protein
MKYCTTCGAELANEDQQFCGNCGTRIEKSTQNGPEPTPVCPRCGKEGFEPFHNWCKSCGFLSNGDPNPELSTKPNGVVLRQRRANRRAIYWIIGSAVVIGLILVGQSMYNQTAQSITDGVQNKSAESGRPSAEQTETDSSADESTVTSESNIHPGDSREVALDKLSNSIDHDFLTIRVSKDKIVAVSSLDPNGLWEYDLTRNVVTKVVSIMHVQDPDGMLNFISTNSTTPLQLVNYHGHVAYHSSDSEGNSQSYDTYTYKAYSSWFNDYCVITAVEK